MTVHTMGRDGMALVIEDNEFSVEDMGANEIKRLIMRMFEENGFMTGGETEIEIEVFPGKNALMVFAELRNPAGYSEVYIFYSFEDMLTALEDLDGGCFVGSRLMFYENGYYLFLTGDRDKVTRAGFRLSEFGHRADPELKAFLLEHARPVIGAGAIEALRSWFA